MFVKRSISAFCITVLMATFLILGGTPLIIWLYILAGFSFIELTRAMKLHKLGSWCNPVEMVGLFGVTVYYILVYFNGFHISLMYPMIATMLLLMVAYVVLFPKYDLSQMIAVLFSFFYAPVMLSFVYLLREIEQGIYLVWLTIIASWACDTGAYVVGMLFGKHKMAPLLSPKKTIEGAIGGVFSAIIVGVVAMHYTIGASPFLIGTTCAICSILSQFGDLAASAIKRNCEIKDFGRIIPGHGGVMDRYDSMIFIAPIIYFILIIFL
ncbi:MAG: phosphatidate cytidylyltransferase [Eubacteriales bacterium]